MSGTISLTLSRTVAFSKDCKPDMIVVQALNGRVNIMASGGISHG